MKKFFKENFALVTGIALPLALVIVFILAGAVSKVNVVPPKYSAILAVKYNNISNKPYIISTDNGNLFIRENKDLKDSKYKPPPPVIYTFDHKTSHTRRVDIDFTNTKNGVVVDPDLDELNKGKIITDRVSPDGYELEYNSRHSSGLFGEIFGFGRSHRYYYALTKDGHHVPVDSTERIYNAELIGWIVEDE